MLAAFVGFPMAFAFVAVLAHRVYLRATMAALRRLLSATVSFGVLGLLACASKAPSSSASDADLIDGIEAPADAFPATMQIVGNCTVTKIADDLILTAAHCVRESSSAELRPAFVPGSTLRVVVRGSSPGERTVTVRETLLHPQVAHLCASRGCSNRAADDRRDAPDVAVVRLTAPLDGVPSAQVDLDEVLPGEDVTILGYGCADQVWGRGDGKLRFRDTSIVATTAAIHAGGIDDEPVGFASVAANYALTPGPVRAPSATAAVGAGGDGGLGAGADAATAGNGTGGAPTGDGPGAAGLCPGDSGGALYRKGTGVVVGVNASYTFLPNGVIPVTNWHARVDAQSRWGVAAWLESVGARTTQRCTVGTCRPSATAARANDGGDAGAPSGAPNDGGDAGVDGAVAPGADAGAADGG